MSKAITRHPEPGLLLRYADGELDSAAQEEIRRHLAECSDCKAWLDELDTGAADYRHTWMPIVKETSSAPPAPWFDLRGRLEEFDRRPVRPQARSFHLRPQWAAAAAAALIAIVAVYRFAGQPVIAAELLRDAVAREAAPGTRHPIRVTARGSSIVRPAVLRQSSNAPLRVMFEAANYSWEDPLSARSFSAWRESLPDRQDRVVRRRGDDGIMSYEISTRTGSGGLEEARLWLRVSDLHAIHGSLRFRGSEVVEFVEVAGGAPPSLPASPPQVSREGIGVTEPVTPGDELRVWAALRRIGADLGEPIDVERDTSANAIVITALGVGPDRRRTLEDALSALPRIQLHFRDPQPVRPPSRNVPGDARGQTPPFQQRLESQLGSRGLAEEFTQRVLEASESALLRAHAVRQLAQHFPLETPLSAEDHAVLNSLYANHFEALEAAARRVLTEASQIAAVQTVPPPPSQNWHAHAPSLVVSIERVDQILTRLLVIGDGLTADLERALGRMSAEIAAAEPAFREKR